MARLNGWVSNMRIEYCWMVLDMLAALLNQNVYTESQPALGQFIALSSLMAAEIQRNWYRKKVSPYFLFGTSTHKKLRMAALYISMILFGVVCTICTFGGGWWSMSTMTHMRRRFSAYWKKDHSWYFCPALSRSREREWRWYRIRKTKRYFPYRPVMLSERLPDMEWSMVRMKSKRKCTGGGSRAPKLREKNMHWCCPSTLDIDAPKPRSTFKSLPSESPSFCMVIKTQQHISRCYWRFV